MKKVIIMSENECKELKEEIVNRTIDKISEISEIHSLLLADNIKENMKLLVMFRTVVDRAFDNALMDDHIF